MGEGKLNYRLFLCGADTEGKGPCAELAEVAIFTKKRTDKKDRDPSRDKTEAMTY